MARADAERRRGRGRPWPQRRTSCSNHAQNALGLHARHGARTRRHAYDHDGGSRKKTDLANRSHARKVLGEASPTDGVDDGAVAAAAVATGSATAQGTVPPSERKWSEPHHAADEFRCPAELQ